jgi:hypothetical protein
MRNKAVMQQAVNPAEWRFNLKICPGLWTFVAKVVYNVQTSGEKWGNVGIDPTLSALWLVSGEVRTNVLGDILPHNR